VMVNKVFGIGMSKTGTTTLGRCFEILGFVPMCTECLDLKRLVCDSRQIDPINHKFEYDPYNPIVDKNILVDIFKIADQYKSFQDTPWYMLFRHLDEHYPDSKFILTVRKDTYTQAVSDWWHNEKMGRCQGPPTEEFIRKQSHIYEIHNTAVKSYFQNRPGDLLIVCWEEGHSWKELCEFLKVPIPDMPFPHLNVGTH